MVNALKSILADIRSKRASEHPAASYGQHMASVALDIAGPLFNRVEFHIDRQRAAVVGTAAILAGGMIALPVAIRQSALPGSAEMLVAAIALSGAFALVTAGVFLFLRLLAARGAILVIDSRGIHDRRSGSALMPWSQIHDIRTLDRHGRHIGIETVVPADLPPAALASRPTEIPNRAPVHRLTVIDTYFLRSQTGNRLLDFIMPLTAMSPLDMSETPVSAETLAADARIARFRVVGLAIFIVAAGVVPAIAAATLLLR